MVHFTVVYEVAWPLNDNEARGELVLIQTPPHFESKIS